MSQVFRTLSILLSLTLVTALFSAENAAPDKVKQTVASLPFVSEVDAEGLVKTEAGDLKFYKAANVERAEQIDAVKSAIADYKKSLKRSNLSDLAQQSIEDILARVLKKDGGRVTDEVSPGFARRLIQHGWLKQFGAHEQLSKETKALSEAVAEAMAVDASYTWRRGTKELNVLANAWGPVAWVLSDRKHKTVAMRPAAPMYVNSIPMNRSWVQVTVAKSAAVGEPSGLQDAEALAMFVDGKQVAAWNKKDGFSAKDNAWRSAIKQRGGTNIENYFPPHIVHKDIDGTLYSIVSENGVLHAPQSPSPTDSEKFLENAAVVMKDGAHLDLIGQYFFKYVYDSPETSVPYLVGNRDLNGDIHQTAIETLSTVAGGVCRGDCDDIAELYHNIIHRQGKLGHVVMLPGHAALAFGEKKGENWSVYVLQTGPALEFKDAELPKALGKAYKHFGATETFDPNGLGLLLRFSNEKTRGPWRLGWRIFSDKEYAETMIDIQEDWHYQTYLQAIKKMQKLLEDDKNKDPANYRELASLYSFTGQYDKFIEYHKKALEQTKDPVSKLAFHQDYINTLFGAQRKEEAVKTVELVLQEIRKPAVAKSLGQGVISYGLNIASVCASHHESKLALKVLDSTVSQVIAQIGGILNQMIGGNVHKTPRWNGDGQIALLRRTVRQYVNTALTAVKHMPEDERPANSAGQQIANEWIKKIGFADTNGPSGILDSYGVLATRLEIAKGREAFLEEVSKAEFPKNVKNANHKNIMSGQDESSQLPWVKAAAPHWAQEILSHGNDHDVKFDIKYIKRLDTLLTESLAFCEKHKFDSRSLQISSIQAQVAVAMLTEDYKRLSDLLQIVKKRDDKWLRDGVAALIGNASRHVKIDAFNKTLDVWVQEVNYKPKYYWIAWRAALSGSPKAALATAKKAAELFKDDPSFVEEYNYMKQLFQ